MDAAIGIIGLGEAGFHVAAGLADAGARVAAYDPILRDPAAGPPLEERAAASGVVTCGGLEDLIERSGLVLSVVVAAAALNVAREAAGHLSGRHLYIDLNSVAPDTKRAVAKIVEECGSSFVEAAIMGPVKPKGHRVPILLAGAAVRDAEALLAPYGTRLEVLSGEVGAASAVKMCRSVLIKGVEALLLECLAGARAYGVDERVLTSAGETMFGFDWSSWADYTLGRVALHGKRRAQEMDEAVQALSAAGVDPVVSRAAAERLHRAGMAGPLDAGVEGYRAIIEAFERAEQD